jgi:hypothetical protein
MTGETAEYNPLDYDNLTRNCVEELMCRGPFQLPLASEFDGAGVYALFYSGKEPVYEAVRTEVADLPIYVGKAVPPGSRKGSGGKGGRRSLHDRVTQHTKSIQAASNLQIEDFVCRYLVVTPLWITMAERFLIEHYQPVWNVCIEGFGNHDPGKGRHEGEITWWDTLHPGRPWASKLKQTKTPEKAKQRLATFLKSYSRPSWQVVREHRVVYRQENVKEFPDHDD